MYKTIIEHKYKVGDEGYTWHCDSNNQHLICKCKVLQVVIIGAEKNDYKYYVDLLTHREMIDKDSIFDTCKEAFTRNKVIYAS